MPILGFLGPLSQTHITNNTAYNIFANVKMTSKIDVSLNVGNKTFSTTTINKDLPAPPGFSKIVPGQTQKFCPEGSGRRITSVGTAYLSIYIQKPDGSWEVCCENHSFYENRSFTVNADLSFVQNNYTEDFAITRDWSIDNTLRSDKGTYKIEYKLGEGGMGDVFKARFTPKNGGEVTDVALKKMKFGQNTYDRCKKEVELMKKISASETSVNNVKMYDGFTSNLEAKTLCISMEFCEMGDLAVRIESKRKNGEEFDQKLIYQYMYDIANGINELHEKHSIVHRDMKPQNILISFGRPADNGEEREVLKISDYGICKLVDIVVKTGGHTNTVLMTTTYAAPEQLAGHACDKSADIWAIGIIFYELCNCPEEFYSKLDSIKEKVSKDEKLVLPSRFPEEDDDWLNQMVTQNRKDRISSETLYSTARGRER